MSTTAVQPKENKMGTMPINKLSSSPHARFCLTYNSTRQLHLAQAPRYASNANENLMIEYMRDNIDMH